MANSSSTSSNVNFLADHPFLFVIRNLNFSLDLLIRWVVDPNPEKVIIVIFNLVAKF
jgi:serine protease inhibitor